MRELLPLFGKKLSQGSNFCLPVSAAGGVALRMHSFGEYVQNGFKVGPNYCRPAGAGSAELDRRRRQARPLRGRRPEQVVDGLQRPWARSLDLLRVPPEPDAARGGLPRAGSPRPVGHRHRTTLSPNANHDRRLHPQRRQPANRQRRNITAPVLQPVELRLQSRLGTRFLGPVPPGDRIQRRRPRRLGRRL